jgi:Protein of unknown function (DUF1524)
MNGGVALDYGQMTIEHLAAENPEVDAGLPEATHIGNLLLVEKGFNNKLANKPFPAKKSLLQGSKLKLDPVIEQATKWTSVEIAARAKWLSERAYKKVWKI